MVNAEGLPVIEIEPGAVKVQVKVGEEKAKPRLNKAGGHLKDVNGNVLYAKPEPIMRECYASLMAGALDTGLSPATVRHWVKVGRLRVRAVGVMETGAHTQMVEVRDLKLVMHKRRRVLKGGQIAA